MPVEAPVPMGAETVGLRVGQVNSVTVEETAVADVETTDAVVSVGAPVSMEAGTMGQIQGDVDAVAEPVSVETPGPMEAGTEGQVLVQVDAVIVAESVLMEAAVSVSAPVPMEAGTVG